MRAIGRRKLPRLTERQAEILGLIARGYRAREIATTLRISQRAVTAHVASLKERLRVPNRSGLIAAALEAEGFAVTGTHRRYATAPFLVAVTRGPDHEFAYVNAMWERVMGLCRRDVIGRPVRDVFPDRARSTYAARQRAYRTGRPATGRAWHYRWVAADGTEREADLRFIYQPLRPLRRKVAGLLLIATEAAD